MNPHNPQTDFKYLHSKNPYQLKLLAFKDKVLCDKITELHQGKWLSFFGKKKELHVELGCNAGHVLVGLALQNPSKAYMGIDWKHKAIFRAALKVNKKKIENILLLRAHAERLPFIFSEGEIDHLSLLFPDPWPRYNQHKHRFVTAERLNLIAKLIKPGGTFQIKTDHTEYFNWIVTSVQKTMEHWEIQEHSIDLHQYHPNPLKLEVPEVTLFEKIYIKERVPIKSLTLRRKPV